LIRFKKAVNGDGDSIACLWAAGYPSGDWAECCKAPRFSF